MEELKQIVNDMTACADRLEAAAMLPDLDSTEAGATAKAAMIVRHFVVRFNNLLSRSAETAPGEGSK